MSPTLSDAKKDLYKLLGLERETATEKQIKSSYRKLALKYHPDKLKSNVSDDEKQEAVDMFQQIGVAYSILSDPKKKAIYDRTGNINSDGFLDSDKDWTEYFKELWTGVVSAETIDAHAKKYRHSAEERGDVLKYYQEFDGDMDKILSHVELSTATDGKRFQDLIEEAILSKQVKRLKRFKPTTTDAAHAKRLKKEKQEAAEAEEAEEEKKREEANDPEDSLKQLIMARQKSRQEHMDSIINSIAERSKGPKRKRRPEMNEPSEEEFQKIQQKISKKKK